MDDAFVVPRALRELGPDAYLTYLALHVMWSRTWSLNWPLSMRADDLWHEPDVSLDPRELAPLAMITPRRVAAALRVLEAAGYMLVPTSEGSWRLTQPSIAAA